MYIDPPSPNVPAQMIEDSDDPEPIENTISLSLEEQGELFSRYESDDFMLEARTGHSQSDQYIIPSSINERSNSDILNQALTITDLPPTSSHTSGHGTLYHSSNGCTSRNDVEMNKGNNGSLIQQTSREEDPNPTVSLNQSRDQILQLPSDQQYILLQGSSQQMETFEEPFYPNPTENIESNLHALNPNQTISHSISRESPQILTVDPSQLSINNSDAGTIIIEAPAGLPTSQLHQILENAGVGQCLSKSGPGPSS